MGLVNIARRLTKPAADNDTELSERARRWWWTAIGTNVMAVIWMLRMGDWLDTAVPLLSMITFGGYHWVVFGLSATGLVLLVALAPLTHGFVRAGPVHRVLLPIAGVLSVAAVAGLLSVLALGACVVLVGTPLLWLMRKPTRIDVRRR
jgi:hypothetical protein